MSQNPAPPPADRDLKSCLACGGQLEELFTKQVLGKYGARYCRCSRCRMLQIPHVHWLGEAYSDSARQLDAGAAQRCIFAGLYIRAMRLSGLLRAGGRVLDFGSGSGLLVRLLRDQGLDATGYDKYVTSPFVPEFTLRRLTPQSRTNADMITAFEVFEHLLDPAETLALLAANLSDRGAILFRTELYRPGTHGPDWAYLHSAHGQHINFFTAQGLADLSRPLDLAPVFLPFGFHMFVRAGRRVGLLRRVLLLKLAILHFVLARAIGLCNFKQAQEDYKALISKEKRD